MVQNRRDGHVAGDQQRHEEGDRSARLRQHADGVHDGVGDASERGCTEQIVGQRERGVGLDVEEADGNEGQNVLQVVEVGAVYIYMKTTAVYQLYNVTDAGSTTCESVNGNVPSDTLHLVVVEAHSLGFLGANVLGIGERLLCRRLAGIE